MKLKTIYLRFRVFLNNNHRFINTVILTFMSLFVICFFVNSVVMERIVLNAASTYALTGKYKDAIRLYNVSFIYYKLFHFTELNKELYINLPYSRAQCYMKAGEKKSSAGAMANGITSIQNEYGIFSTETATFIRKYLIEFYIENNNIKAAQQEFENLLNIYKSVRCYPAEQADLIRILGDLNYARKRYDIAINYYSKAYALITKAPNIDYGILTKIVERIAAYEEGYKKLEETEKLYRNTIELLKNAGYRNKRYYVTLLIDLAEFYQRQERSKDSIAAYENAIAIIKTLPKTNYHKQNLDYYYNKLKAIYDADGQFHKSREIQQTLDNRKRFGFLKLF